MKLDKQKKSVVFVMGFSCPFPGAGWNRISYLAKYFSDKGVHCSILSTFFPITLERLLAKKMSINDAGKIRVYNILPQIPLENPLLIILNNLFSFVFGLPFMLLKNPDIIIVSIAPGNQLMGISWISSLLKKKLVVDYRDEVEENWLSDYKPVGFYKIMKLVFSKIYRDSYLVTPTTTAVANKLKEKGALNIHVVADGVDTKIFRPLDKSLIRGKMNIQKETLVLIFVGYVQSAYRVDTIVRALQILKKENKENEHRYLLLLVGGGRVGDLLGYASSLGVSDMVKYLGIIASPEKLVEAINAADFGMIPYDDAPILRRMYPTKMFEYTACGLPVIGTTFDDSILADYVRKYGLGVTVSPLDSESLAKALEDMRDNQVNQFEMKANALTFAHLFEKSRIAEELFSLIFAETQ